MSECVGARDHAASRAFPPCAGKGMTRPETPVQTLPVAPPETTPAFLAAASISSSASSDTASSYAAADSGSRRGGASRISPLALFFANHRRGRQRSQGQAMVWAQLGAPT